MSVWPIIALMESIAREKTAEKAMPKLEIKAGRWYWVRFSAIINPQQRARVIASRCQGVDPDDAQVVVRKRFRLRSEVVPYEAVISEAVLIRHRLAFWLRSIFHRG